MWTLQTLIQTIKNDLELHDLPPTVTDADIVDRIKNNSLIEFSIIYPRREKFRLSYNDLVHPDQRYRSRTRGLDYMIPKWFLIQFKPTTVIRIDPFRYGDYNGDSFAYGVGYDARDLITDVAEIKATASLVGNMAHAPTFDYDSARQVITLYNGYYEGVYEVEMGVEHDINLKSIPPTAMLTFKELATYDVGSYIYGKIFRKENVETGAGNITLNIEKLRECSSKHDDLMKELKEEAALDQETIDFF